MNGEQLPTLGETGEGDNTLSDSVERTLPAAAPVAPTPSAGIPEGYTEYLVGDEPYYLPDDMSEDDVVKFISDAERQAHGAATPSLSSNDQLQGKKEKTWGETIFGTVDPDDLVHDPEFMSAARTLYSYYHDSIPDDLPANDLKDYALDSLGWFNYNLPKMALDAHTVSNAPDEVNQAFLFLLNKYDDLEFSWDGTKRFFKGAALDPTNYVGLATFGIGAGATTATKITTKEGLKHLLRQGIALGVEAAATSMASNTLEQHVRIEGGEREGFSLGELGGAAAIGGALGGALGGISGAAGIALKKGRNEVRTASGKAKGKAKAKDTAPTVEPSPSAIEVPVEGAKVETPPSGTASMTSPASVKPLDEFADAPWMKTPGNDNASASSIKVEPKPSDGPAPVAVNDNGLAPSSITGDAAPSVKPPASPDVQGNPRNEVRTTSPIIDAVNSAAPDAGMRVKQDLARGAKPAVDTILALDDASLEAIVEEARKAELRGESNSLLKAAFADATQDIMTRLKREQDITKAWELNKRLGVIRDADLSLSSDTGSSLAYRRGNLNTGDIRTVSVDSILEERGINPKLASNVEKDTALVEFQARLAKRDEVFAQNEQVRELSKQVERAMDQGDIAKAIELNHQKNILLDVLDEAENGSGSAARRFIDGSLPGIGIRATTELFISNVMSPASLVNNLFGYINMAVRPGMDVISGGPTRQAWYRASAMYSTYLSSQKYALQAAKASFSYETQMLKAMGDIAAHGSRNAQVSVNGYTFYEPAIKGKIGSAIRTIPRLMTTIDEYFSQMSYRGYVAGEIAARAYDEGVEQGLKGKALKAFINSKTEAYEQFAFQPVKHDSVIDFLRKQGILRGLSGEKLNTYIKTNLTKNGHLFQEAIDNQGMNYTDALAFRNRFDPKGNWSSRAMSGYENIVNEWPLLRIGGQLFIRTPIRVFQAGARLTPGMNLIDPSFLRNLAGKGPGGIGGHAQMRAQGEAILSSVIGSTAFVLYAKGISTGDGAPKDWREGRSMRNPDFEPYTFNVGGRSSADSLRGPDTKVNYRNYDPFATPFKVITSALEQLERYQYRKAQGEDVGSKEDEAIALLYAGSLGLYKAIRDANLFGGMAQFIDLLEGAQDIEKENNPFVRFMNQKLIAPLVPSAIGKAVHAIGGETEGAFASGTMPDPVTTEQFIRARFNPYDPLVPRMYDPMGFPYKRLTGVGPMLGIQVSSKEDRSSGDARIDEVRSALASLTVQTGQTWIAPYKESRWASGMKLMQGRDEDLRTKLTSDGKETWYDRLQRYVAESDVIEDLHEIVTSNDLNALGGTPSNKGPAVKAIQDTLTAYRQDAYARLMEEEDSIINDHILQTMRKENNKWLNGETDGSSPQRSEDKSYLMPTPVVGGR